MTKLGGSALPVPVDAASRPTGGPYDPRLALEAILQHLGPAAEPPGRASETKCEVVIADGHELFRRGVRALLESYGHDVAGEAATEQEAVALVESHPGSIALLDVDLPDSGGFSVLRSLEPSGRRARCLVLGASTDAGILARAISFGACGYLTKDCRPSELVAAIELVHRGGLAFGGAAAEDLRAGMATIDQEMSHRDRRRLGITDREFEILGVLPTSRGLAQIAGDLYLSKKTVQNNVSTLYRKLDVGSRQEAVAKAIRLRLILRFSDN